METQNGIEQAINSVKSLVEMSTNKVDGRSEGKIAIDNTQYLEYATLTEEQLADLSIGWKRDFQHYFSKIEPSIRASEKAYAGTLFGSEPFVQENTSANFIFSGVETYIPFTLQKTPEPVVYSSNDTVGRQLSEIIKTKLQSDATLTNFRGKLKNVLRFLLLKRLGCMKIYWDSDTNDVASEAVDPETLILDPNGYIDETGDFTGKYIGERKKITSTFALAHFPKIFETSPLEQDEEGLVKSIQREFEIITWNTPAFVFTTYNDEVIETHESPNFDFMQKELNHFAKPKLPFVFLSLTGSMKKGPYDSTSLILQNIPNQRRISDREKQISRGLKAAVNSTVITEESWSEEQARNVFHSIYEGGDGFVFAPGSQADKVVHRIPAPDLPSSIFVAQDNDKAALKQVFGTEGLTAEQSNPYETVRGKLVDQQHATGRIGGGLGDNVERFAENVYNWWVQMYSRYYDQERAAISQKIGPSDIVKIGRNIFSIASFVVTVAPGSALPKDELAEANQALELWNAKALDLLTLYERLKIPDPLITAQRTMLYQLNPELYIQQFLMKDPQAVMPQQPAGAPAPGMDGGGMNPQSAQNQAFGDSPVMPEASPDLSQVPINQTGTDTGPNNPTGE